MKTGIQTWGSDGDIRPFLALAGGLRAKGHEVSMIVTSVDNKDYRSFGKEMDFALSHIGKLGPFRWKSNERDFSTSLTTR